MTGFARRHDDVSIRTGCATPSGTVDGRAEITPLGRLALTMPPPLEVTETVTLYPAEDRTGCGLSFAGGRALTWLDREDAIAMAHEILAQLEPETSGGSGASD